MNKIILIFLYSFFPLKIVAQYIPHPPVLAHSHNDYQQKHPFFTALKYRFNSIEIDILRDGDVLRVAHDSNDLHLRPDINKMYFNLLESNAFKSNDCTWLLVDLKTYDRKTLDLLHQTVSKKENLFQNRNELFLNKPYQIILSGDIPRKEIINNEKYKFFFIDGRPSDLKENYDSHVMPLISTNFTKYTQFNNKKNITDEELKTIKELVHQVQKQNKKIRFWKTKDRKNTWHLLIGAGVDVIGVDHLKRFHRFQKKLGNHFYPTKPKIDNLKGN